MVAFLMRKYGWSYNKAINYIKMRWNVNIHTNLIEKLKHF